MSSKIALALGWMLLVAGTGPAAGQRLPPKLEAALWIEGGGEPVLSRGQSARVYYRTTRDAFVAVFRVDTGGAVRLVFPASPDQTHRVRGGTDYRLLFPQAAVWQVEDEPGTGYFFVVASEAPLDFGGIGYSRLARGWDLSSIGRQISRDPWLAMEAYAATLAPEARQRAPLAGTPYHVGQRYGYPRFVCYGCHEARPFAAWNPYLAECTAYQLSIDAAALRGEGGPARVAYAGQGEGVGTARFAFRPRGGAGEEALPSAPSGGTGARPEAPSAFPPRLHPPPEARPRPALQPRPPAAVAPGPAAAGAPPPGR